MLQHIKDSYIMTHADPDWLNMAVQRYIPLLSTTLGFTQIHKDCISYMSHTLYTLCYSINAVQASILSIATALTMPNLKNWPMVFHRESKNDLIAYLIIIIGQIPTQTDCYRTYFGSIMVVFGVFHKITWI